MTQSFKPLPFMGKAVLERFVSHIPTGLSKGACWEWAGETDQDGYGKFQFCAQRIRAHRISYAYHYGKDPADKMVCHLCDNPRCVNPYHLWLGTNSDNMIDASLKRLGLEGGLFAAINSYGPRAPYNSGLPCNKCGHLRTDDYFSHQNGKLYGRCRNCVRLKGLRRTAEGRRCKSGKMKEAA